MSDMPDLSSLIGMLNNKGIDVNNLMKNVSNNNNSNTENIPDLNTILNSTNSSKDSTDKEKQVNSDFQMPDMETIMKIMKLMNSMNSNASSPSANLLYSLKPFLRESKQEKIDQYIKFLKISSVIKEINKSGGDNK